MEQKSKAGRWNWLSERPRQEVTGDMKLEARELSFRYDNGNRQILNKMSMTLESTDRLGLIAPSGFGKTTFCKILAGYEEPDSGEVLLEGKPLSAWKGYCPVQMIWQHPELSVNPRWKMGEVLKEGDQVEKRIIDGLGIELDWLNRYPSELSGGELQRFCIARALGQRTRFLLADEISTMLDLITQSQLWNFLLEEVKNREIGLMAVSHSEVLLERICTKIVRLNG
ncbi:ABC transporter, ATP-binding protein [Hungatella hathewayi DSM 13479]|jgi:ABC-type dipeptide/oligopeptide/nickel transport system ATPase subunit|uniref:ABC transporter, ATP-binding protein n=2 Tax=Hungatella hathewayi TaxID=154046 RepID=D3AAX8_9FIRM|nr:ABC transporter, ATP-binding protein [Hungatella hathewayi DSM 13479]